jgi:hypothetical protein
MYYSRRSNTSIPIQIGDFKFPSKVSVEDHVLNILRRSQYRKSLTEDDFYFIENLYRRHPMSKNLAPIWDIQPIPGCKVCTRTHLDPCFLMKCSDGVKFCFPHSQALYPIPGAEPLRMACREAVWEQILRRKQSLQDRATKLFTCTIDQIPLLWGEVEIDHAAPGTFEQLVWDWLWSKNLYIDSVPINVTIEKRQKRYTINDLHLLSSWRHFHSNYAKIRPLCKRAHERISKMWYESREIVETATWPMRVPSTPDKPITRQQRVRRGFKRR